MVMKMEELFTKFLELIESEVTNGSYNLWFAKLKPISLSDDTLKVLVPMEVHKSVLTNNYKDIINDSISQVCGHSLNIEYLSEADLENEMPEPVGNTNADIDHKIDTLEDTWETNLKPEFTFENYIVGDSNKLAYVSAQSVAQNPGKIHNPLFIYGKSGIGKTHLMQAIGNYIVKNTNLKVLYVTSGEFKEEYSNISAYNQKMDKITYAQNFKNKYQGVDVLIVDDIQYLVGADQTQQEFFHTFNALYQKDKQIIISSDRSPEDLEKIEDRLKSRFMMGLPIDIYPPDLQLRCKIIRSKLRGQYLEDKLSDEVIEYIANICTSDVRQLVGAINRVYAEATLWVPEKIDINFVNDALKSYVKTNIYAENSISKIKRIVADYFEIDINDLRSKKRTATIAKARQIAMYLCRMQTEEKLEIIGMEFGKDHSTVSAAIDKITNDMKRDVKLNTIVKELQNKL